MQVQDSPRRAISKRRFTWLEAEARQWEAAGTIAPEVRRRILAGYSIESAERRGTIAMVLIAATLCSVGLLLLIGYNWDEIPRAAKLALVIGAVAATFGAAAVAYARGRAVAGETLVFLGTLLYGNAIWLVAQILNIEGRFPDAFLWWGLGVLACAWLVRSKAIGAEAALLVLIWTFVESTFTSRYTSWFLVVWPLAVAVAYALHTPVMIRILGPAAAFWVFFGGGSSSGSAFWLGGVALMACALYAVGRWHADDSLMGDSWQTSGLLMLLLAFIPLLVTAIHRQTRPGGAVAAAVAITAVASVIALSASLRKARVATDNAVLAVAAATLVWTIASWSGKLGSGEEFALAATILFSILALVMAASLIRAALTTDELTDLAGGIAFALLFLIVRWASVIENLLWSGVLLLGAGGGLLLVARLWRRRPRAMAEGRVS